MAFFVSRLRKPVKALLKLLLHMLHRVAPLSCSCITMARPPMAGRIHHRKRTPRVTDQSPEAFARRIVDAFLAQGSSHGRQLLAVAGPPATGKSTVAEKIVECLEAEGHPAGLLPMDGFHLDNSVLEPRGLLPRKGAPETFDLNGFMELLQRVKAGGAVKVPTFDRDNDRVVPDAEAIAEDKRVIVVEGNYLLYDATGWRDLNALWDFSVFVRTDVEILRQRLIDRWLEQGLNQKAAEARAEGNDLANARAVMERRMPSSLELP